MGSATYDGLIWIMISQTHSGGEDGCGPDAARAFGWITDLLEETGITYRISGGLAARSHGSKRPLADIDIEVSVETLMSLAERTRPFVTKGPSAHVDANWNIMLLTLLYGQQVIELSGLPATIFNAKTASWDVFGDNIARVSEARIFDRIVPVVTRAELIEYKTKLDRDVDREDILNLSKISS